MQITIVGGGFGGVKATLELAKDSRKQITLISDQTTFQYYPTLYSTATGYSHQQSWVSLRKLFRHHKNVKLVHDKVKTIDTEAKKLKSKKTSYSYETLILALGSVTTYFGIKGLDTYAFGIKSEAEIRELQTHIFTDLQDGVEDEKNYVVIGAGPTGVELAGALGEYIRKLREYFGITKKQLRISLIEAAPRVLPALSEANSARAEKRLKELGVHVETNKRVEEMNAEGLIVAGKPLATQTVIWTSGVANAPFYRDNPMQFTLNERGKVVVDDYMQASPSVYVIGDNAATPHSGLAQTALHDALFVVRHINGSKSVYKPKSPPCVVPIGHHWALFEWGKLQFGGIAGALMHRAANLVGYSDIMPIGWAIGSWRSGRRRELRIPEEIS